MIFFSKNDLFIFVPEWVSNMADPWDAYASKKGLGGKPLRRGSKADEELCLTSSRHDLEPKLKFHALEKMLKKIGVGRTTEKHFYCIGIISIFSWNSVQLYLEFFSISKYKWINFCAQFFPIIFGKFSKYFWKDRRPPNPFFYSDTLVIDISCRKLGTSRATFIILNIFAKEW